MLNSGAAVWTGLTGMRDGGNLLCDFYIVEIYWVWNIGCLVEGVSN